MIFEEEIKKAVEILKNENQYSEILN